MNWKCDIYVKGLNMERIVNNLTRKGVPVGIKKLRSDESVLSVGKNNLEEALRGLTENGCDVKVIRERGAGAIVSALRKSFIIWIFLAASFAAAYLMSGRIGRVEVESGSIDEEVVYKALGDIGIDQGTRIKDLDIDAIENKLSIMLPQAEYVLLSFKGNVLTVRVTDKNDSYPVESNEPRDIKALYDGVVTRIVALVGTAAVKVGDSVKAGDVLIKGEVTYSDGSVSPVRAQGRVYAEVEATGESVYSPYVTEYERSGRSMTYCRFYFAGSPIGKEVIYPYEFYTESYTETPLAPMPMTRRVITVEELVPVVRERTLEECMEMLKAAAEESAREKLFFLPAGIEFTVDEGAETVIKARYFGESEISESTGGMKKSEQKN